MEWPFLSDPRRSPYSEQALAGKRLATEKGLLTSFLGSAAATRTSPATPLNLYECCSSLTWTIR